MTKIARNARKSRKVNVSPVKCNNETGKIETLQIAFYASEPDNAHVDEKLESTELLVIDAPESANENDVFAMYEAAIEQAFNARVERDKSDSVASQIRSHAKTFANERVARLMYDARVMPDFPVKSRRADAFFNVKAIDRMSDVLRFCLRAQRCNEHLRIIFASAYKFQQAGLEFSGSALDMIYNKRAPENFANYVEMPAILYTSGTRSAQQSMTLNALIALNVFNVVASKYSNKPAFEINHENVIAQTLIAEMQLA